MEVLLLRCVARGSDFATASGDPARDPRGHLRAPRSGPNSAPRLLQVLSRAHGPYDWPPALPVFSFAANLRRSPGYALRSSCASSASFFGAPPLLRSDWSPGMPVFFQSSNLRPPLGPSLPAPRAQQDHPGNPLGLPIAPPLLLSDWLQELPVRFMSTNLSCLQRWLASTQPIAVRRGPLPRRARRVREAGLWRLEVAAAAASATRPSR